MYYTTFYFTISNIGITGGKNAVVVELVEVEVLLVVDVLVEVEVEVDEVLVLVEEEVDVEVEVELELDVELEVEVDVEVLEVEVLIEVDVEELELDVPEVVLLEVDVEVDEEVLVDVEVEVEVEVVVVVVGGASVKKTFTWIWSRKKVLLSPIDPNAARPLAEKLALEKSAPVGVVPHKSLEAPMVSLTSVNDWSTLVKPLMLLKPPASILADTSLKWSRFATCPSKVTSIPCIESDAPMPKLKSS
ncbi:hypothetical protein LCGC14_0540570 [marine sediment metagenome]|uniref:Uncharacterized protein n=1 Tax=marine sediment metagenome TaxID=412755 RepID=A0A0F9RXM7_9ZZZZ